MGGRAPETPGNQLSRPDAGRSTPARSVSPRTCRLLGEVAMCAGEMEALSTRMTSLHAALGQHAEQAGGALSRCTSGGRTVTLSTGHGDDDEELLEAERTLEEYLSSAGAAPSAPASLSSYLPRAAASETPRRAAASFGPGGRRPPSRGAACGGGRRPDNGGGLAPAGCGCDARLLLPSVCELDDLVRRRRAELLDLRRELRRAPAASPEFAAMADENGELARRAHGSVVRITELRGKNAALAWSVEADRRRCQDLRLGRRRLLEEVGELERLEAGAWRAQEASEAETASERQQTRERTFGHEAALEVVTVRAARAERRLSATETSAARLVVQEVESETRAAERAHASARQAERQRRHVRELESCLEMEAGAVAELQRERLDGPSPLGAELAEAEAQASEIRSAEAVLARQLADSRRRQEMMEQKALDVARELFDSSQAITWLKNEVSAQGGLRHEVREARRRSGVLRASLAAAEREAAAASVELPASYVECGPATALASGDGGAIPEGCPGGACDSSAAVERELKEAHTEQMHAVNEALQAAWEAEARQHRTVVRKLDMMRACIGPVQQQLVRLATLASLWREDLLRSGSAADRRFDGDGEGDRCGGSVIGEDIPPPPTQFAWDDEHAAQESAKALCTCLESLVAETGRRLAEAPTAPRQCQPQALTIAEAEPRVARQTREDSFVLRAERLSLARELERITRQHCGPVKASSGAYGAPSSASSVSGELPDSPPPQERKLAVEQGVWPPSPVPRRAKFAGGSAVHRCGDKAAAALGRNSLASPLSSVSLHERGGGGREPREEAPALAPAEGGPGLRQQNAGEPAEQRLAALTQLLPQQLGRSLSGPLYRLDRSPPRPTRAPRRAVASGVARVVPARQHAAIRQIPVVRRQLEELLDDPADRFDIYSVHRLQAGAHPRVPGRGTQAPPSLPRLPTHL